VVFGNHPVGLCQHAGCPREATMWVLSMSTHYPVFCLEHRPPSAPTPLQDEDDVEEGDDLRSRLRLAENVCYYAQRLLKEPTTNLDVNIPALRAALRAWVHGAKA